MNTINKSYIKNAIVLDVETLQKPNIIFLESPKLLALKSIGKQRYYLHTNFKFYVRSIICFYFSFNGRLDENSFIVNGFVLDVVEVEYDCFKYCYIVQNIVN